MRGQRQLYGSEPHPWNEWIRETTARLSGKRLLRELVAVQPVCSSVETSWPFPHGAGEDLRPVRSFGLNDYLGLAVHPQVRRAISSAALEQGSGPRSSALLGGYTALHRSLESELADLKHSEDALLLSSGFAANMAVLTAFAASPECAIFSDALNHASIVDGARLAARSGAEVRVFRHKDSAHLEELLRSCTKPRRLVVTDTLFSMDGDYASLPELVYLKQRYGFLLVVDDAHGTLVCGPRGEGAASDQGVADEVDICVGTLSKAFGCHGGFVALSSDCKQLLLNRGRSYVYSTALPVPMVAGALAALRVATQQEPWRQQHLKQLTRQLSTGLGVQSSSPIVPLLVGSEANVLAVSANLLRHGFYVPAVRPPTVPQGTCRLRISLSAAHTTEDVGDLVTAIKLAFEAQGLALASMDDRGSSSQLSSQFVFQSRL